MLVSTTEFIEMLFLMLGSKSDDLYWMLFSSKYSFYLNCLFTDLSIYSNLSTFLSI